MSAGRGIEWYKQWRMGNDIRKRGHEQIPSPRRPYKPTTEEEYEALGRVMAYTDVAERAFREASMVYARLQQFHGSERLVHNAGSALSELSRQAHYASGRAEHYARIVRGGLPTPDASGEQAAAAESVETAADYDRRVDWLWRHVMDQITKAPDKREYPNYPDVSR